MSPLVVLIIIVSLLFVVFKFRSRKSSEETLMIDRFKARFDVSPRSTKAQQVVTRKIVQLRTIAARGTTDDIKELELALKVAKQYGFAQ